MRLRVQKHNRRRRRCQSSSARPASKRLLATSDDKPPYECKISKTARAWLLNERRGRVVLFPTADSASRKYIAVDDEKLEDQNNCVCPKSSHTRGRARAYSRAQ